VLRNHNARVGDAPVDLRLGDLVTFLAVQRYGSIAGAARELMVTPSQVSKAVSRLEQQLHLTLLSRSVRGVTLTDAALRIMPDLEQAVGHCRRMIHVEDEVRHLTVAAPSYLVSQFLPVIAQAQPQLRLRGLELPPAMLRAHTAENFFDLGLIPGGARLPATWQSQQVGVIRKGLFARPELMRTLGPPPVKVEAIAELPFVAPVYSVNGKFVPVDDDCPLTFSERRQGHEVQTFTVALELVMRTDQLVFGPVMGARRLLETGQLVEIPIKGWNVSEPLLLVCNTQRLRVGEHRAIVAAIEGALREQAQ
jgi:DNA-binding transcriptional LysR family regulator